MLHFIFKLVGQVEQPDNLLGRAIEQLEQMFHSIKHLFHNGQRLIHFFRWIWSSGGGRRTAFLPAVIASTPFSMRSCGKGRACPRPHDANHQPHAAHAHGCCGPQWTDAVFQVLALCPDRSEELPLPYSIENRIHRGAHVPPKVVACVPGSARPHASAASTAPIGRPPPSPFGHRDDIGRMPYCWKAEQAARAADAGLHLVDESSRSFSRQSAHDLPDKRRIERSHAALALHQFEHDRARHIVRFAADRIKVVCLRVIKALGEREK